MTGTSVERDGEALQRDLIEERRRRTALEAALVELVRSRSAACSYASHELRTPLTSISGYLELIEEGVFGEVPEELLPVLDVIGRNADRLRALVEDLLAELRGPIPSPSVTALLPPAP